MADDNEAEELKKAKKEKKVRAVALVAREACLSVAERLPACWLQRTRKRKTKTKRRRRARARAARRVRSAARAALRAVDLAVASGSVHRSAHPRTAAARLAVVANGVTRTTQEKKSKDKDSDGEKSSKKARRAPAAVQRLGPMGRTRVYAARHWSMCAVAALQRQPGRG